MSTLTQRLDDYLAVRRSLGFDLSLSARVLRRFTAFADREETDHITVDLFLRWKVAFGKADNNTWSSRLGMVRVFARWLQGHDERTEVPPAGLIPGSRGGVGHTSTRTKRLSRSSRVPQSSGLNVSYEAGRARPCSG